MNFDVICNDYDAGLGISVTQELIINHGMSHTTAEEADVFIVLGGDGTMLNAIRTLAKYNKPFMGFNTGTLGFLMNEFEGVKSVVAAFAASAKRESIEFSPLNISAWSTSELLFQGWAFNDVWVEREGGQTLAMDFVIDMEAVATEIRGDGVLVCTPQGSTAYNKALGGRVIPPGINAMQITPMAAMHNKKRLDSIIVNNEREFMVFLEQTEKRPGRLFVDGVQVAAGKDMTALAIQTNKKVKVELLFTNVAHYLTKVSSMQFVS